MHPMQPAVFPGFVPSDRRRCPRLQLRGSAGFTPASLSSPSGKDARSEEMPKSRNSVQRIYTDGECKVNCTHSIKRAN